MDAQRRDDITGWDAREFSDGFDGLRRFADRGFSGAATNGAGWLFLFDGQVVGTVDADLDAFADASGTVYEAPHESLPVLFAMQERGGEPRAQYYTNDTPLSAADRKLSQGGFTGYIELSENVLSGDYYVVYTGGTSMSAAYVGNARRLETGADAFELADDEVGIYAVYAVELDVRELPAPERDAAEDGTTGRVVVDPTADGETNANGPGDDVGGAGDDVGSADFGADSAADAVDSGADAVDSDGPSPRPDEPASAGATETESVTGDHGESDDDPTGVSREPGETTGTGAGGDGRDGADFDPDTQTSPISGTGSFDDASARDGDGDTEETDPADDVFSEETRWREETSIPSLDPSETRDAAGPSGDGADGQTTSPTDRSAESGSRSRSDAASAESGPSPGSQEDPSPAPRSAERSDGASVSSEPTADVRDRIRELEAALAEAESAREELAAERDAIREEHDAIREERDQLRRRVEELRSEVDRLRGELSEAESRLPEGDRSLSPGEALAETNLFVRYDSKGGATLDDAHDGAVDRTELRENLRIEHHTSFETEGVVVDGKPFEEFLRGTIEYGFTRWLVEELTFEVDETGNTDALRDLYDALPEIDRAEIRGSVSLVLRDSGEETREQRSFDLVLRDRLGNPLFIAELNDSRAPTQGGVLESLVANGGDLAGSNDAFAGAFAVTASFFEPDALETASSAVGGGLFNRSKRKSFVRMSRKRGFHLCLVESRDGGFHLTVPDL
jgi:Uncharacterized archaeal coiled-coil protein